MSLNLSISTGRHSKIDKKQSRLPMLVSCVYLKAFSLSSFVDSYWKTEPKGEAGKYHKD
jgi:hypothetical protein